MGRVAQTVVFTWLYNYANDSVVLTTPFHAAINAVGIAEVDLVLKWWLSCSPDQGLARKRLSRQRGATSRRTRASRIFVAES
jgi:hypothetical protein